MLVVVHRHDGVCGLGGSGNGSATLIRVGKLSACQPQLGYGGALGMLVAGQVDGLRPVDKGVPKSGEIKVPSDHEGAKQFVTQELMILHALIRSSEGCVPTTEDIPKIVTEAWPQNSEVPTFGSIHDLGQWRWGLQERMPGKVHLPSV